MMTRMESLRRLLRPFHIAVVGGNEAAEAVRQCQHIGFQGKIWPVNPRRKQMAGLPCYPNVAALPQSPDATFIAVPRAATIDVAAALAENGAGGAVCYASGFAEEGGEGIALQEKLVTAMGDMPLIGPNCYGLLNYLDGVALWPDQHGGRRVQQGVAIITQSGNIGLNLTMQQRSVPLAYLISVGNQVSISLHEYIEALIADERVTAIGLHVEGLTDVAAFSRAALKALAQGVPIVALKSGTSELGRQIAKSHTSSLVGADQLVDALFARCGVMRVHTLPQFMEALKFLSVIGTLPSNRIASISCSGGEAGLVADAAARLGLSMPPLVEKQREAVHAALGGKVALSNPLDYHTYIWGDEEAQTRCFSAMMLGTQEITLKLLDYPRTDRCDDEAWIKTARAFCRAVKDRKARGAVVASLPENLPQAAREMLLEQGVVPMQGIEETLIAIRGAAWIYERQRVVGEIRPLTPPLQNKGQVRTLDEAESKRIIRDYGISTPQSAVCSAETAVATAQTIGFPVAIKLLSDSIIHKSDVGGVHLNLHNPEAVQQAVAEMQQLGEHFLVEAMVAKPVAEMIMGIIRDPQFGLALMIGVGGILVELLQDRATLLLPTTPSEVEAALSS
ncbi:MAG: acetate--CoA ligase family protein, partial [Chloroflexi bacterium]|nr:acetate--CoA ligase family protein [Chloroflexota bacterium]